MYLGIDLGTSVLKLAIFDARTGKKIGCASKRLRTEAGEDGRREQDPNELLRVFRTLLGQLSRDCLAREGWKRLRGVGVAAQGGSTMFARREDGQPRSPMILWSDTRALGFLDTLKGSKTPRFWKKLYLREGPCIGLARLVQLRDSNPDWFGADSICIGAGEFLYFHLTGRWVQDPGHALQAGCYDAGQRCISPRCTALADVKPSFFASLRRGHETHGVSKECARASGLPEGVPVAGPYMDQEASYMAITHASRYPMQCSLGTAWVGSFTLQENSRGYSNSQLVIPSPVSPGHLVIQALSTGNIAWDWALQTLIDPRLAKALAKQEQIFAERILPPEGLIWLPWISRRHPLQDELHGAGAFVGISPCTTRDDLVRAVAAGLAAEFGRVFHALIQNGTLDSIILSGGSSAAFQFVALFERLFDPLPTLVTGDNDYLGNRGSLFAFGGKAYRCDARPAPRIHLDEERLQRWRHLYCRTVAALYGHTQAAQPYNVGGKRT